MENKALSNLLLEYGFREDDVNSLFEHIEGIKRNINVGIKNKKNQHSDIERYQPDNLYQSAKLVLCWLKQFHFNNSEIVKVITGEPSILTMNILLLFERINSLSQLLSITHDNIHKLITECPMLLLYEKQVIVDRFNVLVNECGLDAAAIEKEPILLTWDSPFIVNKFNFLVNKCGFDPVDIKREPLFLLVYSEQVIVKGLNFLVNKCGLDTVAIKKVPQLLANWERYEDYEQVIVDMLNFLVNKCGLDTAAINKAPHLLLEDKQLILDRVIFLVNKCGLDTAAINKAPHLLLEDKQLIADRFSFLVNEYALDGSKINANPEILNYDLTPILDVIIKSLTCSKEQAKRIVGQNPQTVTWSEADWLQLFEFYCSIGLSEELSNNSELFSHSIDIIYARYCFYQALGININANNYQLLFESESVFHNKYNVSDDDLIESFPLTPESFAKKKRKI